MAIYRLKSWQNRGNRSPPDMPFPRRSAESRRSAAGGAVFSGTTAGKPGAMLRGGIFPFGSPGQLRYEMCMRIGHLLFLIAFIT